MGVNSLGGVNPSQTVGGTSSSPSSSPPPGPQAIPRRHAPADVIARQGSFRGFPALSQKTSPFKRQLSLRMNELPSTMQRKSDFPMRNTGESQTPILLPSSPSPGVVIDLLAPFLQCRRWRVKATASARCALRLHRPSAAPRKTPSPQRLCLARPPPLSLLVCQVVTPTTTITHTNTPLIFSFLFLQDHNTVIIIIIIMHNIYLTAPYRTLKVTIHETKNSKIRQGDNTMRLNYYQFRIE